MLKYPKKPMLETSLLIESEPLHGAQTRDTHMIIEICGTRVSKKLEYESVTTTDKTGW